MKNLFLIVIFWGLLGCVSNYDKANTKIISGFDVQADQILLMVKVRKTDYTGYYPSSVCEADQCIPVSFWYIHEAEVMDVIKGKYEAPQVSFANLQHADYIDEIKNEWYILLQAISNKELKKQLKVNYYVVKHDSEFQRKH